MEHRLRTLRNKRRTRFGRLERWLKDHKNVVDLAAKIGGAFIALAKLLGFSFAK